MQTERTHPKSSAAIPAMATIAPSYHAAQAIADDVVQAVGLAAEQAILLSPPHGLMQLDGMSVPGDPSTPPPPSAEKNWGLELLTWRGHLLCGALGGLVAAMLWLASSSHPWISDWPLLALLVYASLGVSAGMFAGGRLEALHRSPQHQSPSARWHAAMRAALSAGRWGVVFRPATRAQVAAIADRVRGLGLPLLLPT